MLVKGDVSEFSNINYNYARLISEISTLKLKNNISYSEFLKISKTDEIYIPLSIFDSELSPFETIVIYLRDNLNLRNKDIAKLTNRDERAISMTYRVGLKKSSRKLNDNSFEISFPLSLLKNRKKSILEIICFYLYSEKKLTFNEISSLLKKNYQTIWTVIRRYNEKNEK